MYIFEFFTLNRKMSSFCLFWQKTVKITMYFVNDSSDSSWGASLSHPWIMVSYREMWSGRISSNLIDWNTRLTMIRKMNEESTENETFKPELGYLSKQDICSLLLRFRFRFRFRRLNFMSYHGRIGRDGKLPEALGN